MGQFKALCYKNWILFKRSIIGSILQFFIPIIFVVFVLAVKRLITITNYQEQQFLSSSTLIPPATFSMDGATAATSALKQCPLGQVVALSPSTDSFIINLQTKLQAANYTTLLFNSNDEVDAHIRSSLYGATLPRLCFGVSMVSTPGSQYSYQLRFNISVNEANTEGPITSGKITLDKALSLVMFRNLGNKGMMGINTLINSMIMSAELSATDTVFNKAGPIYQQSYIDDPVYTFLGTSIQILVMLPLLVIYLRQTSSMLSEKQKKIRETMSIMGMSTFTYFLTWFLRYFITYLIVHLICSAILRVAFNYITFITFFIIFVLFDLVLLFQSFFIQVFFSRAKLGIVFALLFFVIQYVLSYIVTTSDNPTLRVNNLASIVPHIAFILSLKTMVYAQSVQVTPTFSEQINNYTLSTAVISLVLNAIAWLLLTWYLEQVVPKQFGTSKHPLFCCVSNNRKINDEQLSESQNNFVRKILNQQAKAVVEQVDQKFKDMQKNNELIRIQHLRKMFGEDVIAVNDLTLNIYNDQIFVLLGHNGAGKTTTISMITGMVQPTAGEINILGETDIFTAREMIGICPQHDTLYDDLTVEEHLYLVGTFKGLQGENLDNEVLKLVNDVNLMEKKDQYSMNLSGGQKRRLSVAMAFSGGSKVIVLDQPTSGMDTSARRYIWQMLKNYKKDRIVLLTTHFMDQADYLGDRIGIMGSGKLICCGSSIFLKNQFGVGYNITFVKENNSHNSQGIIKLVKKYVDNAVVLSDVSSQLSLQLPLSKVKNFDSLFNEIDSHKKQLEITTYGISITTLEQVFLKVTSEAKGQDQERKKIALIQQKQAKDQEKRRKSSSKIQQMKANQEIKEIKIKVKGSDFDEKEQLGVADFDDSLLVKEEGCCGSFFRHLSATIIKRLRIIRRDFKSFIFQLILPIAIIILGLFLMRISFLADYPSQQLTVQVLNGNSAPMMMGIGSSDSTLLGNLQTQINSKYGSLISLDKDTSSTTDLTFDSGFLKTKKSKFYRGGIFFNPMQVVGGNNQYAFTSIINTRCPNAAFVLPNIATQALVNQIGSKNIKIKATNSPFPRTLLQLSINNTISGFFASFVFSLALAFKFASIASFIVKERTDRSKHQQIVSGMNVTSYWIGNFIYDYLTYLVLAVVTVILIKALSVNGLSSGDAYGATWILFILFGLTYIPCTYVFSNIFKDYGNAQAAWYFFTFIVGGMLPTLVFVLRILGGQTSTVGIGIAYALKILPSFAFGEGLINMGSMTLYASAELGTGNSYKVYDMLIALSPIIYLVVFFFFYSAFVLIIQKLQNNERFMRFWTTQSSVLQTVPADDSDVIAQQTKALAADPQQYTILTKNLRKVYKLDSEAGFKVAVDNMSVAISKGEVFGLLGVNGAGKTTTFKMLAGQVTSTSGDSYFMGMRISQNLDKVRQSLGYCPQFDALIENLTLREQIELFYDLKSLPTAYKDAAIDSKMKEMDLTEYSDKLSGTLSGGNKRKLSVAMAMIGNPKIIFLDQPSTGMDPKARRFMWKVISRIATEKKQSTIILTTHSMEEAEALSTRLGIMVGGNFKCIGTPQHIKSKFGQGYQIQVKIVAPTKDQITAKINSSNLGNVFDISDLELPQLLQSLKASPNIINQIKPQNSGGYLLKSGKRIQINSVAQFILIQQRLETVKEWINKSLGDAEVIQQYQTFIRFKTKSKIPVGKMFGAFQSSKQSINVLNYSIKQASVEQIFNKFAGEEDIGIDG